MTEDYRDELGGQPSRHPVPRKKRIGRAPQLDGCMHTTDPNGWVMDAEGRITGKCPCWEVYA